MTRHSFHPRKVAHLAISLFFFLSFFVGVRPSEAVINNRLGNNSFEDPLGGTNALGNWNSEPNRGVSNPMVADAPDGNRVLRLSEPGTVAAGFVGIFTFQLGFLAKPGDIVAFSGLVRQFAAHGADMGELRIEFQKIDGTFLGDAIASVGATPGGFTRAVVSAVAPDGTDQVVFTVRIQPSHPGDAGGTAIYDFDSLLGTVNGNPVVVDVTSPSKTKHPGDLTMLSANVLNVSADSLESVELVVNASPGLTVLRHQSSFDGHFVAHREGSVIFSLGDLGAGQVSLFALPVVVSSGALPGKSYSIAIFARRTDGTVLSETTQIVIRVEPDPLFDEGTILGKVFDDRNEDGVQSKGEIGVPGVKLYTEYGVSVVTDMDGKFHIPAVKPARHVLKVDGHTLPKGTTFVTEESLLVKTTPGLLSKVRFAVHLPESALPDEFKKDLQVWVTQGVDLTRPELKVTLEPSVLKVGLGRLERDVTFRIKTNYPDYIAGWRLEVVDDMGERVWTGVGISAPPSQIYWNGTTDVGEIVAPGVYAYRLVVRDSEDREDWTPLQFFKVVSKADSPEELDKPMNLDLTGNFNIFRDGKKSIPLVAKPTVRVYGKTEPGRRVKVGETPVDVRPTGEFEQEFFVVPGDKKIVVSSTSPEGETVSLEEKLSVKDSYFFLVALGEEELGINDMDGNLETVGRDDAFHEDFYEQGRLSYYLKAKVKGKFLVKSRYDTGDKRSQLFTHLDPDDYYPVYGDYSTIEYEGQDTQQRLFILVEMDRSFLKWGSYQTDFTDTELARYNRTLSGLKVHYETVGTTKYGDAKRGFSVFFSKPETQSDHNEFRATGGSLYYLRNRNVIQGSDKVRIEIRDKIQDIPIESRDLIAGRDYEIDHKQGRILLREPLSSVSASQTIISNDILDGNPVFLIVDYEFESFKIFEDKSAGLRGFTHMGDHIRIGGTVVDEDRAYTGEYQLRAVDTVVRVGRNTKVTAEYAEARFQQVQQALSFDGGLSFQDQRLIRHHRNREKAYLIKAESKPIKPLDISGYIQNVEPGFSVDDIKSQEGFRKYGLQAKLKLHESFYLLARHDSTEVSAQIRPLPLYGVTAPFEKLRSTTAQAVFDRGKWSVIGEYLHQHLDVPISFRTDSLFSEKPFGDSFGLKIAHRVLDWLTPYAKGQITFSGKQNYQIGGGLEIRAGHNTKVYFEEMLGNAGDATVLGVSVQKETTTSYANLKVRDSGFSEKRVAASIGSSHQLSERSRVYTEREYSMYSGSLPFGLTPTFVGEPPTAGLWDSDIYGYETQFWDRWNLGVRYERRHLDSSDYRNLSDLALANVVRTNTWNTIATSLGYDDKKKLKFSDTLEVRIDQDAPRVQQWLTQNRLEWKINQDLSFLGRMNFGTSEFLEPGFMTGRFIELNTGFAYRPVESDRLNWLARYTYLNEVASEAQFVEGDSGTIPINERSHIFAVEGGYELTRYLQMVEKFAYRFASIQSALNTDRWISVNTFLWIHRFNFHVTRKWDLAAEYRMLFQTNAAESLEHGPLVEIDREIFDYVRFGIGYNFTDFNDDLRESTDFSRNGFFVRLTGKV